MSEYDTVGNYEKLKRESDAQGRTIIRLSQRITDLEATLEEILGWGCCDNVRPKTLERWRAVLHGSRP